MPFELALALEPFLISEQDRKQLEESNRNT
jgi:hypothetical protein